MISLDPGKAASKAEGRRKVKANSRPTHPYPFRDQVINVQDLLHYKILANYRGQIRRLNMG